MFYKQLVSTGLAMASLAGFAMAIETNEYRPATEVIPAASEDEALKLPELPYGITSFGAARIGDSVYVYGGNIGSAHSYSNKDQSNELLKLDLNDLTKGWTKVSEGERLQGLGMVASGEKLVLIGGFFAKNPEGQKQDLHSTPYVSVFNTTDGKWEKLPELPKPRSSHDAAILGSKVYVVGGWFMNNPEETEWHKSALVLDLQSTSPKWEEIAPPPSPRRALAVAAHAGKIYAIGGMNEAGKTVSDVAVFDPEANSWSEGPNLNGDNNLAGFGASAWSHGGKLYVSTVDGSLQVLADDGKSWQSLTPTDDARFFHRVLSYSNDALISIGGASMETGKFLRPEVIPVGNTPK